MPQITLTVDEFGKPKGATVDDEVMYARWRARVKSMRPGDVLTFSYDVARCEKLHGLFFKSLEIIYENQDLFTTDKELREWIERGARHVELLTLGDVEFERVKSIDYATLDGDEFALFFNKAKAFLLSEKALRKLWPHASVAVAYEGMTQFLEGRHQ